MVNHSESSILYIIDPFDADVAQSVPCVKQARASGRTERVRQGKSQREEGQNLNLTVPKRTPTSTRVEFSTVVQSRLWNCNVVAGSRGGRCERTGRESGRDGPTVATGKQQ